MKIKELLCLVLLGSLLVSCGLSGDGRLFITAPALATDYRDISTGDSIGCDTLDNLKTTTQVRARFRSSGYLKQVNVRLKGLSSSRYDRDFYASLYVNDFTQISQDVRVMLSADASAGQLLPTSTQVNSIVVNPKPNTVKYVQVYSEDRLGLGFYAEVQGVSDLGYATGQVRSLNDIPVYGRCYLVSVSNEVL